VKVIDYRVLHRTFERLELTAVKVARSVLRGGKVCKDPTYPNRGDDTPLSLDVAQNRNGLRVLTIQESHAFKRVECQSILPMT
jgi:hypothetical protein